MIAGGGDGGGNVQNVMSVVVVCELVDGDVSVVRQDEGDDCATPTAGGSSTSTSQDSSPSRPIQKNRRRCFSCKVRLELAFMEIGRCKCGKNDCSDLTQLTSALPPE